MLDLSFRRSIYIIGIYFGKRLVSKYISVLPFWPVHMGTARIITVADISRSSISKIKNLSQSRIGKKFYCVRLQIHVSVNSHFRRLHTIKRRSCYRSIWIYILYITQSGMNRRICSPHFITVYNCRSGNKSVPVRSKQNWRILFWHQLCFTNICKRGRGKSYNLSFFNFPDQLFIFRCISKKTVCIIRSKNGSCKFFRNLFRLCMWLFPIEIFRIFWRFFRRRVSLHLFFSIFLNLNFRFFL